MWGQSILTILYLFIAIACGAPYHDSDSSEENGVVYVFNMYAVKNMNTKAVGKMLDHESITRVPENFQSIGSFLYSDAEGDEPISMKDFASYMEEMGFEIEKLNEGSEPRIIEIKVDDSLDDFFDFEHFEELAKALQAEGILLEMSEENGTVKVQIEFDESIKSREDQPFTLEELGEIMEAEGILVSYVKGSNGQINKIVLTIYEDDDETQHNVKNESRNEVKSDKKNDRKIDEKEEKKIERKMEKNDEKQRERKNDLDDQYLPLDFTTKSEVFNKIRRRRSSCPECKAAGMIKAYIEKHDFH